MSSRQFFWSGLTHAIFVVRQWLGLGWIIYHVLSHRRKVGIMSAWSMAMTCRCLSLYPADYLGLIYMVVVTEIKERANPNV